MRKSIIIDKMISVEKRLTKECLDRYNGNYIKRISCSIKEINNYVKISKKLTKDVINVLNQ